MPERFLRAIELALRVGWISLILTFLIVQLQPWEYFQ